MARVSVDEGLGAVELRHPPVRHDARGWLVETLRAEWVPRRELGQIFVTAARPGMVKGNHYHRHKREWFCVIRGQGQLVLEDVTTAERKVLELDGGAPAVVAIPPRVSHTIRNTGRGLLYLLVYSDTIFDAADPDTFPHVTIAPTAG